MGHPLFVVGRAKSKYKSIRHRSRQAYNYSSREETARGSAQDDKVLLKIEVRGIPP